MSKWRHFKIEEFDCKCCGKNEMQDNFIDKLDALREFCQFPLIVSSGYRCPTYNDRISTTGLHGPHTTGRAVDFAIAGSKAHRLLMQAFRLNGFSGIGINQKGLGRFIHLDDLQNGQRPWIWTY